ncbi:Hemerythrin HHE cation binding domain protein [uncultured archaeon]|nr:Hemerythrin HHE cation binding domain protein [uncultured archaeon]
MIGAITSAMLKQHRIVNGFLNDFEKVSEEEVSDMRTKFDLFRWNLEKHVFIEERNIFTVADKKNKVEMKQLQNLLKDHKDIIEIIDGMVKDILDGVKPNVSVLREILFAHEQREVESFYPLLDNRLSAADKKNILEKISEINLG